MTPSGNDIKPWYREPWPWVLMGGPVAAVVTGAITLWLAIATDDGLVADDYYKQGLAINRVLERDSRARAMGIRANIALDADRTAVALSSTKPIQLPSQLKLHFAYATKSGLDRVVTLAPEAPSRYVGSMPPLAPGRWRLTLEDIDQNWRLTGEWRSTERGLITLEPR